MNSNLGNEKQQACLEQVISFAARASGVRVQHGDGGWFRLSQKIDGKSIELKVTDLEDVLMRSDTEGQEFIQINFSSGKKILVTTSLIGFKPIALQGLDLAKLPRVVTTPDILSVFEAIQDALHAIDASEREVTTLKKVFEAVLAGGESVGFDLSTERSWLARIPSSFTRTAA